mmetsp:Transcript_723/g.1866  ORF Transcript_723/g.1866 Transcript_723/m.1866 type:complete len:222 (-) Transcript_723:185-850(-)
MEQRVLVQAESNARNGTSAPARDHQLVEWPSAVLLPLLLLQRLLPELLYHVQVPKSAQGRGAADHDEVGLLPLALELRHHAPSELCLPVPRILLLRDEVNFRVAQPRHQQVACPSRVIFLNDKLRCTQHHVRLKTQSIRSGHGRPAMVRLDATQRHNAIGTRRERVGQDVLELPDLIPGHFRARMAVALDVHVDPELWGEQRRRQAPWMDWSRRVGDAYTR